MNSRIVNDLKDEYGVKKDKFGDLKDEYGVKEDKFSDLKDEYGVKEDKFCEGDHEDDEFFGDLFSEPRDKTIYNLGDLKFEWLDEEDVSYTVRVCENFHIKTNIKRVRDSMDRLLEDNDKPDILKWSEANRELEMFCDAAAQAGRDVIDFDMEMTEILDAVWKLLEDENDEFNIGDGEEGPEYYQENNNF